MTTTAIMLTKEETMTRRYLATLPLISLLFLGAPSFAEAPSGSTMEDMVTSNVQRLVITNQCQGCYLIDADLSGTHLIGADLRDADLIGADLSWSNLEGADLTGANLTGANLTGAFLTNASLVNADLDNVNFSQAQLYYVDVTGASMDNINLANAIVEGTAINIGGGTDPAEDNSEIPIFMPEDDQLLSPPNDPWYVPRQRTPEILDVPPQIMPQT